MEAFLEYILKASGILVVFYLTYHIFLKKETFFEANRHFLLAGLLVAFLLPLLTITRYVDVTPVTYENYSGIPATFSEGLSTTSWDWMAILSDVYLMGLLFLIVKFALQLLSLRSMIKAHSSKKENGFVYVETNKEIAPFSFFNYIFYNPHLYSAEELQAILEHERAHSSQWHTLDVLLAHAITMVLWINPFGWLYKKNIKQNLEFLADESAAKGVTSLKSYQYTLLRVSGVPFSTQITNAFYNSLIKKRIVMLHKSKSDRRNLYKYALVLPLLLVFVLAFNIETKARPIPVTEEISYADSMFMSADQQYSITKETTDSEIDDLVREIKNEGGTLLVKKVKRNKEGYITAIKITFKTEDSEVVGQYSNDEGIPPIFFGEDENGGLYINGGNSNTHSNSFIHVEADVDNEHEHDGDYEVIVKRSGKHKTHKNVWVSKDSGKDKRIVIENVDGKKTIIVDGKEISEEELEKEGIIHKEKIKIKTIDNDDKGNVMIIMSDDDDDNDEDFDIKVKSADNNSFFFVDTDGEEEPLILIDGKEVSEKEVKALSPDKIATINVIKGEKAESEYGNKGKNGVVIINTKKED
ncbi:M56 family metallopeptidase [Muriicola sp. Z0-33]|uniref:M56 family metallopeptidase n=1 Tax=Muriicola sp. Z0-33 TaxID=2816957 RepID=UPI0022370A2D|nr:M56 family metallopeptidase [Muriicola sp. Z0-33]MCW5517608.1 M56 family peptidase [Muriicola sp. Z0-33]